MPTNTPLSAWYFPYINLTFNHGLASMACLWDRVYRVVPFGLHSRDGQFVKNLQSEIGLLETIHPTDEIATKVDTVFIDWLEGAYIRNDAAYLELFSKLAIERTAAKPHRIFKAERHPALTAKLEELGLSKEFAANWKGTSRLVQDLYLVCLAHTAFQKHESVTPTLLVTDRPLYTRALQHARFGFGPQQMLCLTIELPLPVPQSWRNADLVDFNALTEYRENCIAERTSYFNAIQLLVTELTQVDDFGTIEKCLNRDSSVLAKSVDSCTTAGKNYNIPLERGYLLASVLLPQVPFQDSLPPSKRLGNTAYRLDCLAIAEQSPETIQHHNQPIFTLSLEEPLVKPKGMQSLKEKVKKILG